jgi:hypothetical protein
MDAVSGSRRTAMLADGLTAARALLVFPLFFAVTANAIEFSAGLLAVAWWSDFLDGTLARRTTLATRLGPWDLLIDTMVGAGLLGGLVAAGATEAVPWGLIGLILFGWYLRRRNPSASMTFQAIAYGFFIAHVWTEEPAWVGVLVVTIIGIMLLDWHHFVGTTLPTFFAGFGIGSTPEQAPETK